MADIALKSSVKAPAREITAWDRLKVDRNWLGFWFMLPAAAFLILFLAYPLGLGVWLSFTDARLGRAGVFVGTENYEFLWDDSTFWLSVFNTLLYTAVASSIKFAVGLYLALLLNEKLPFKAIIHVAGIGLLWLANERSIERSVVNAIDLASGAGFRSMAFPLIGAGTGGVRPARAEALMLERITTLSFDGEVRIVRYRRP